MNFNNTEFWEQVAYICDKITANMSVHNVNKQSSNNPLGICFESISAPNISIYSYINRLHEYAQCSSACFLVAFVYIDRIIQANPDFGLNPQKLHRFILTALVVAIKYLDDSYASNAAYAALGGISVEELNLLELSFIVLLRFNFFVNPQVFQKYSQELVFQCQKLAEADVRKQESMVDCNNSFEDVKTIRSINTIGSTNDMLQLQ